DKTHLRRRRLTRSWWNDVWRDRLLAAMHFLAAGESEVALHAGNITFSVRAWPLNVNVPVSYDAADPPLPREEDEEGNITPTSALDSFDESDMGDGDMD